MTETQAISENIQVQDIKKRAIKGIFSLSAQRAVLQVVSLIASILLARFLSQEDFGVFAIVSFVVTFFGFFSDIGLAAALIQKKGEITKEDLRTTFTIQQSLVVSLVIIIIVTAPLIVNTFYRNALDSSGILLIQVLAFSLLLSSLKSIPAILLERALRFDKLIIPEIIETLIFNILVVYLAWNGSGVWSYIIALLSRGVVGLIIIYIISPWPIGIAWSKKSFKTLYSFGIPFQLNSLIALIKDNVVPTFVAAFLGPAAVGYIVLAQKFAYLPLTIMNDIIKVTFPAYSRLQEYPELLSKAINKTLYFISFTLYPLLAGLMALMPWFTQYVLSDPANPTKWTNALPIFYLFCINTFWASLSTTFTNALFAIGKSRLVLNFMIQWTILTWTLIPLCTYLFGSVGVGVATAIIAFTSIGVIIKIKEHVKLSILSAIGPQFLAASIMGVIVHLFARQFVNGIPTIILATLIGIVVYAICIYIFTGKRLSVEMKAIIRSYKKDL